MAIKRYPRMPERQSLPPGVHPAGKKWVGQKKFNKVIYRTKVRSTPEEAAEALRKMEASLERMAKSEGDA